MTMTAPSSSWVRLGIGLALTGVGVAVLSFGGKTTITSINEIATNPSYVEIQRVLSHIKTTKGIAKGLADVAVGSLDIQYKILQLQKLFDLPYGDAKLIVQYSIQTGYEIPCVHTLDVMHVLQNDSTAVNQLFDLNESNSRDMLPTPPKTLPSLDGGTTPESNVPN